MSAIRDDVDLKGTFFGSLFGRHMVKSDQADVGTQNDATMNSAMFTEGVRYLKGDYKAKVGTPETCNLMQLLWDLVHHNRIRTACVNTLKHPRLHFWQEEGRSTKGLVMIQMPLDWWRRMMANPWFHMGGMIHMASMACDYWHNTPPLRRRAYAWEAEFILWAARKGLYHPRRSRYHTMLVSKFPKGRASLNSMYWYYTQPFDIRKPRARESKIWASA